MNIIEKVEGWVASLIGRRKKMMGTIGSLSVRSFVTSTNRLGSAHRLPSIEVISQDINATDERSQYVATVTSHDFSPRFSKQDGIALVTMYEERNERTKIRRRIGWADKEQ